MSGSVSTCNVLDTEITVPVQATAGTPFLLSFSASAYGTEGGSGNMGATIVFAGLPAGSSVTSCQGFHQDFPVPVARTTWGSLKARYR